MSNMRTTKRRAFLSLSYRIPLIFVLCGVIIMVSIMPILYLQFKKRMISEYSGMAKGVTDLMKIEIDAARIDEYIDRNYDMPEYSKIRDRFYALKDSYPGVKYMYVYQMVPEGGRVIFNLGFEDYTADAMPGSVVKVDEAFLPYMDDLCEGREVPVITDRTNKGYLLTYMRPVLNEDGEYQCHVGASFSLDKLNEENTQFIITILWIFAVGVGVLLYINILVIRRLITIPLNKIARCARGFTYETEEDRRASLESLEKLNVKSRNEIGELYNEIVSVFKDCIYYMTNLSKAKQDIHAKDVRIGEISETAFKDPLTSVGNKASYNRMVEALTQSIKEGNAQFAIVMSDINNLKYINDTYGHKAGDLYIKGCCTVLCSIYKHSPVFRIGGDEFVVVLRNEDYAARLLRMTEVTEAYKGSYGRRDKEPWELYSASVGMAEYENGDDSVEQVLKRADEKMYQNKEIHREKYGRYR